MNINVFLLLGSESLLEAASAQLPSEDSKKWDDCSEDGSYYWLAIQPFLWVTKANALHEEERHSDLRQNFLILHIFYTILGGK